MDLHSHFAGEGRPFGSSVTSKASMALMSSTAVAQNRSDDTDYSALSAQTGRGFVMHRLSPLTRWCDTKSRGKLC